jgi:hypothetical protein
MTWPRISTTSGGHGSPSKIEKKNRIPFFRAKRKGKYVADFLDEDGFAIYLFYFFFLRERRWLCYLTTTRHMDLLGASLAQWA